VLRVFLTTLFVHFVAFSFLDWLPGLLYSLYRALQHLVCRLLFLRHCSPSSYLPSRSYYLFVYPAIPDFISPCVVLDCILNSCVRFYGDLILHLLFFSRINTVLLRLSFFYSICRVLVPWAFLLHAPFRRYIHVTRTYAHLTLCVVLHFRHSVHCLARRIRLLLLVCYTQWSWIFVPRCLRDCLYSAVFDGTCCVSPQLFITRPLLDWFVVLFWFRCRLNFCYFLTRLVIATVFTCHAFAFCLRLD